RGCVVGLLLVGRDGIVAGTLGRGHRAERERCHGQGDQRPQPASYLLGGMQEAVAAGLSALGCLLLELVLSAHEAGPFLVASMLLKPSTSHRPPWLTRETFQRSRGGLVSSPAGTVSASTATR